MAIEFAEHLQVLFKPKRYKVLWGGRGAGRSWGIARALLVIGRNRAIRVLCCRELQKSISESVHAVLKDQIVAMGMEDFYRVEVNKIYGLNGTVFSFEGIKNNVTAIKSYEGIDYCWVEEANKVSRDSWKNLIPTIRKETPLDWRERGMEKPEFQAEIWLSFNPDLETDYTYTRFVKDKRLKTVAATGSSGQIFTYQEGPDAFVVKMTYKDNPWFPHVLKGEMEAEKERDFDEYLNVWEGHTKLMLEGAVLKHQLRKAREEGRFTAVPYEPEVPVDCFLDLGQRDRTSIWFGQYVGFQFRLLSFFEGQGQPDVKFYIDEIKSREYTIGTIWLPHDAKHSRLGMQHSIEKQFRIHFEDVQTLPKIAAVADGVNMLRMFFGKCWFDEMECADGIAHLSRWAFKVVEGQFSKDPYHDSDGHMDAADALRAAAQAFHMPKKKSGLLARIGLPMSAKKSEREKKLGLGVGRRIGSGTGWMS